MLTEKEIKFIREKVGDLKNIKPIAVNAPNLGALQGWCIALLDHISEIQSEYVNQYNNPAAGYE